MIGEKATDSFVRNSIVGLNIVSEETEQSCVNKGSALLMSFSLYEICAALDTRPESTEGVFSRLRSILKAGAFRQCMVLQPIRTLH